MIHTFFFSHSTSLMIVFITVEKMKTLITAHSGSDNTPDNSLEFVSYALKTSADALEIDVRKLNGKLVISHDEASDNLPTLQDAFSLVIQHPSMKVNCDLKESNLELEVCQLAASNHLEKRLILTGTVNADLFPMHEFPDVQVYLNIELYVPNLYLNYREIPDFELKAAEEILKVCHRSKINTVNINQVIVTRRFIEILKKEGVGISAWTVDIPLEMDWFFSKGVTNMTTRNLAVALKRRLDQK